MKSKRLLGLKCPTCAEDLDGYSHVDQTQMFPPVEGDQGLCFYCGALLECGPEAKTLKLISTSEAVPELLEVLEAWKIRS